LDRYIVYDFLLRLDDLESFTRSLFLPVDQVEALFRVALLGLVFADVPATILAIRHKLSVLQLFVKTKSGSLLKFLVASLIITSVRVILCMGVDVLRQILFLSEVSTTHIAYEALEPHVQRDEMTLETEPRGEVFATVGHRANERVRFVAFGLLSLYHLVKDVPELLFLLVSEL
jgi:hypothetical protein